jgi:RNA polymerase sigma-70 factor (ECF subfamily)
MRNLSDEDVMLHLRQGHPEALVVLFDRFYRLVLRVATKILRDPAEAEDVMQDVFFEIFNRASQYDPAKGTARTWILQYAYHRSLNRRQYLSLRNYYDRHNVTEDTMASPDPQYVSWGGLTFQEWRRAIERGMKTLTEKQRKTLELACFQGLLLSEIAERTQESLPNVRHHYYRGLAGLRKYFKADTRGEEDDNGDA